MRDHLFFFLNGTPLRATGRDALQMLASFLRQRGLPGTKIACAEGACGSCSVLLGRPTKEGFDYAPINACIFPLFGCDGCHIITIEGLNGAQHASGPDSGELSAVQSAMVECHGAQCGFCTSGIVITLSAFHENQRGAASPDAVQSALEGNLCRCTGYQPIIEAGTKVEAARLRPLAQLYPPQALRQSLNEQAAEDVAISVVADDIEGEQQLFAPRSWPAAVAWKAAHPDGIVVAGATEIGVAMSVKGFAPREILSLSRIADLDEVTIENGTLLLGARATWTQIAAAVRDAVPELAALLRRWGSPQLRNAGTVAGNIVRASPISDSLPFLLVCEAVLELESTQGTRRVGIEEFLQDGPNLRPDELLRRVTVPLPATDQTLRLFKVSKRRAFDRSIVSAAFLLTRRDDRIQSARVAFGGVASDARRLHQVEEFLRDKPLHAVTWREAGLLAQSEISPVSNAAASREYRSQLVANLFRKFGSEF